MKYREFTEKIIGCAYRVYNGGRVEIKRKVRDFDEDLSRFQRDQKSLFERPKLLQFLINSGWMKTSCKKNNRVFNIDFL